MPNVHSKTETLFKTLGTNEPYSIPYNQRPYKWGQANWDTLWSAIFDSDDHSSFFGTIILLEEEGSESTNKETQVFDGQQRITTLTVLIKAAIETLHESGNEARAGELSAYLLLLPGNNPRLNVSENLKEYFKNNIQTDPGISPEEGTTLYEKTIFKAYSFFKSECVKHLSSSCGEDGATFYENFSDRLKKIEVVVLTISDMVLGIEIFESVNATGEKLDASELVKNILIKYDPDNAENIHNEWTEINDKVIESGFKLVDFLHYYWISKHPYTGKNKLFQTMKAEFSGDSAAWQAFFKEFKLTVDTLHNLYVGLTFDTFCGRYKGVSTNPAVTSKIINYLSGLKLVSNKSWIIPVFTLFNYELKINALGNENNRPEHSFLKEKLHKLLEKHFVFSFVHFNVLSLPTRDYTPAMYSLAKKINLAHAKHPQEPDKSIALIKKVFQEHFKGSTHPPNTVPFKWPNNYVNDQIKIWKNNEDKFIEGVNSLKYNQKTNFLLKIIFSEIITKNFDGNYPDFSNNSFEHYLPQDPTEWNISLEVAKKHFHKLGNILWINRIVNSSDLQNKPHLKKLEILREKKSKLDNFTLNFLETHESAQPVFDFGKIDEDHLKTSNFENNPSEIDKRTKIIAKYMFENYVSNMNY